MSAGTAGRLQQVTCHPDYKPAASTSPCSLKPPAILPPSNNLAIECHRTDASESV